MKTAVEWLVEQLKINNYLSENAHWLIEDANEMFEQQIIDAVNSQRQLGWDEKGEQYYNEEFKK
jgi:hypothetical protein